VLQQQEGVLCHTYATPLHMPPHTLTLSQLPLLGPPENQPPCLTPLSLFFARSQMSDMSYTHGHLAPPPPHEPQPLGPNQDPFLVLMAALITSQPQRPSTPGVQGLGSALNPAAGLAAGSSGSSAAAAAALETYLTEAYERALVYVRKAGLEGAEQLHTMEVRVFALCVCVCGGGKLRQCVCVCVGQWRGGGGWGGVVERAKPGWPEGPKQLQTVIKGGFWVGGWVERQCGRGSCGLWWPG